MSNKKQNAKNIKAVGVNLGPASSGSLIDALKAKGKSMNQPEEEMASEKELNLPGVGTEVHFDFTEKKNVDMLGNEVGKINRKDEADVSPEPNIEDVLREFLLKKAHLFVKDDSYGGFVAKLPIGVIKISDFNKELIFEDLRISLLDEEIEQFLSARLNLQKEFLKTF